MIKVKIEILTEGLSKKEVKELMEITIESSNLFKRSVYDLFNKDLSSITDIKYKK